MIIYKITNKVNGKAYIGQTTRALNERWANHCRYKKKRKSAISEAIRVYGKDNFSIEIVATALSLDQLDELEKRYILELNTLAPNGYNLKTGGSNGYKYTRESKAKMREAKLGKMASQDTKDKMSKTHKERWNNTELKVKKSKTSKEVWKSEQYRQKIMKMRAEYWSDLSNRKKASNRAKSQLTDDLRKHIGQKVKESFENPIVKEKLRSMAIKQQIPVVDSNGVVYNSIKEAAATLNIPSSSIVKTVKGHNKTAAGLTFRYLNKPNEKKGIIYLVCGLSGSGKSWVCKQLSSTINYVSFDKEIHSEHIDLLREATNNGNASLYDPTIGISTFIKRNSHEFDIRPVFIIESKEVIQQRLINRGGHWRPGMDNRLKSMDRRTLKYGHFHGTSQEVLDYLKKELNHGQEAEANSALNNSKGIIVL